MRRLARLAPPSALLPVFLFACGGGGHGHTGDPDAGDVDVDVGLFYNCDTEPRATAAIPGLTVSSNSKAVDATLEMLSPATLMKGNNTWQVHFTKAGEPVSGATVKVTPTMPDHGHGTKPVTVKDLGDGTFELTPLYLYMAGYWEVAIDVTTAGATESVMFPVCISG